MISDTLVIYAAINRVNGVSAREGVILYNPTPTDITLTGYRIHSQDMDYFAGFGDGTKVGDTIGAFGYLFLLDGSISAGDNQYEDSVVAAGTSATDDTLALYLGAEDAGNVVDFWRLGTVGNMYHGDKKETSAIDWDNKVWFFRNPGVMFNHLTSSASDSPLMGGGGMINRPGETDIFQDTRDFNTFGSGTDSSSFANSRGGWTDRMKFFCTAPVGSVASGVDFTVYCTAAVNFGKRTGTNWEGTDYGDSLVGKYTGSRAFGDFTVSAGTLAGISGTETEFISGKMNGNSGATMNITGTSGQINLFLSDAYCTGYTTIEITAAATADSGVHLVDGVDTDWAGSASMTGHDTTISKGEFIYTGVGGDRRTDAGMTDNQDIQEVRFTGDSNNLYILVRMKNVVTADSDEVYIGIAMDRDQDGSDGSLTFLADEATGGAVPAQNRGETDIALHVTAGLLKIIEVTSDGEAANSWQSLPASTTDSIFISEANNLVEAAILWKDLSPVSLPQRIRFTLVTYDNVVGWNNDADRTGNYGTDDGVDVMTPYCDSGLNSWNRDLSDGDYDSYVNVNFNRDGRVNHYPDTPSLSSPANAAVYTETDNTVTLTWGLPDYDSGTAKDSVVFVQVGNSDGGSNIIDTELHGIDLDLVYAFPRGDTYFWRVRHADDYGTSPWSPSRKFYVNAYADTLDIITPLRGVDTTGSPNRHETTTTTIILTGRSSGDSTPVSGTNIADTIRIRINNTAETTFYHTETGIWRVSVALRENSGETITATLYRYGGTKNQDTEWYNVTETLTIVLDNTKPRISKREDTYVEDGDAVGAADQNAMFYVFDTGSAFDENGGCTLYWHVDSGVNTNWAAAGERDDGAGTWAITATIPVSSLSPDVDTKIGFWWICRDDVTNLMDSTSLSPAYTDANPGTFTVSILDVRDVVISEVMADGDTGEYVEVYNTTGDTVSLDGWTLMDAGTSGTSFRAAFGTGNKIRPFGYFLVMSNEGGTNKQTLSDPDNHDSFVVGGAEPSRWNINDLAGGDTLTLRDGSNVEIDSSSGAAEWSGTPTDTSVTYSLERKLTSSGGKLVAGAGDDDTQWDTNTGRHGQGGRRCGTPGHANSINVPNITSVTANVVQARGRGEYDIVIANGNVAFEASNGRILVTPPADWSPMGTTSTESGYTTVASQSGGSDYSSLTTSGRSAVVRFTAFPAAATITLRYGDNASSRNAIAQFGATPDRTRFQLFYDTAGTEYDQVGDSVLSTLGGKAVDTIVVVWLDTYLGDTNPAGNPQSFIKSEYEITWTVSDSLSRKVFGAHVTADTAGSALGAGHTDTMFPHLSEYSSFTGFYQPAGSGFRDVSGWTNSSGEFVFTVKLTETEGANNVLIRDTDFTTAGNAHVYTDSASTPVPNINEIGWDGTDEFIELYNPTHQVQNIYNWHIRNSVGTTIQVDSANFRNIGTIAPFSYVIFVDAINTVQDSGTGNGGTDSQYVVSSAMSLTDNNATDSIQLRNDTKVVDMHLKTTGLGWYNDAPGGDGNGTPDKGVGASLERLWPNRSGTLRGSWAEAGSDSQLIVGGASGYGSPGRPNASALSAYKGNFMDPLDTYVKATDTAEIDFTMRLANNDTQPNQQIGIKAAWAIMNNTTSNTGVTIATTPSGQTNDYGTTSIRVYLDSGQYGKDSYSQSVSGTLVVRVLQPFGIPDTTYIVFDRGDSLGYLFQASETDIFDTSATNALVVYVGFSDSFSGLDSTIMPQFRWRIGTSGTFSSYSNLKLFSGDTYLAQIDISSNTWAIKQHDTIFWQVIWRDRAGNWDTSPANYSGSREFIDNTRARDTLASPTGSDTLSGSAGLVQINLTDQATDYCTVTIKYDTYSSKNWTDVKFTSASADSTDIATATDSKTYNYYWNTKGDLPDTTIASVRLRIEVWDGFDTHTDTSGFFGVTNQLPDSPVILIPGMGDMPNTTTVRVLWVFKSSLSNDTQTSWEVQIDTGPDPDWLQLTDSQTGAGTDTDANDTKTISLTGARRYHVRMRTQNKNGYSPYSHDTWFWVPKRIMDGSSADWLDTSGPDTDAGYMGGGEFIWTDSIGDLRSSVAPSPVGDFDLTEFRVVADSYFVYFLFRMSNMSANNKALFSLAIDSNRSSTDTHLNWLGDDAGANSLQDSFHYGEVNIDYSFESTDSSVWLYRDTTAGDAWLRPSSTRPTYDYFHTGNKIAEMAISREDLRVSLGDTMRITLGVGQNDAGVTGGPVAADNTVDFTTIDFLDHLYPGGGYRGTAWEDDLSDGKISYSVDIYFTDTGEVRRNGPPTGAMTAMTPSDNSDTSARSFKFQWQPATDADSGDTVTYWFRLDDDVNFGSVDQETLVVRFGETVPLTVTLLDLDTYYWQVRARDNHGQYSAWSDTFEFRYKKASIHDGDTSDWIGTPSSTAHDTIISNGEFIYTGVVGDSRTENGGNNERDITQVRFSGDTTNLRIMVRFRSVDFRDSVHVALGIDKDRAVSTQGVYFIGDEDGLSVASTSNFPETAILFHDTGPGQPRIEMFDSRAAPGANWHTPTIGGPDSIAISTLHDVMEAAVMWKDLGVTLPAKLRFILASYANVLTSANSGDATQTVASGIDATDVMTPYTTSGDNAWGRDLSDGDFDSSVMVNFNRTGLVNQYPDTPKLSSPADAAIFSSSNNIIAFQWLGSDADSVAAVDSAMHLQVSSLADFSTLLVDSNFYGLKDSVSIGFNTNDTYFWRVRHRDDFGTSTFQGVGDTRYFGINATSGNTAPYDTILTPSRGDSFTATETYGGQITIKFVLIDADSGRCTAMIQYSTDSGRTWAFATLTDTSDTGNLYTPSEGDTKTAVWKSKSNVPDTLLATVRLRVYATDGTDTGKADTTITIAVDNQRPPIVPQCTALANLTTPDSGVYIFWAHAPLDSDVKGYRVFRSSKADSATAAQATSSVITDTTGFKDLGVVQGDTWYYYVVSVDTYDNFGDSSMQVDAPYVEVTKIKDMNDSTNPKRLAPGDTIAFRINVRNIGFAPARGVVLYDYVPQFGKYSDSATSTSVESAWTIEYRVDGAAGVDIWQTRHTDTATIVRFTRNERMDPKNVTSSDTLKIKVKIE